MCTSAPAPGWQLRPSLVVSIAVGSPSSVHPHSPPPGSAPGTLPSTAASGSTHPASPPHSPARWPGPSTPPQERCPAANTAMPPSPLRPVATTALLGLANPPVAGPLATISGVRLRHLPPLHEELRQRISSRRELRRVTQQLLHRRIERPPKLRIGHRRIRHVHQRIEHRAFANLLPYRHALGCGHLRQHAQRA